MIIVIIMIIMYNIQIKFQVHNSYYKILLISLTRYYKNIHINDVCWIVDLKN